jgi:hypothetical protein
VIPGRLAVARIPLADEQRVAVPDAVRSVRAASAHIEACAGSSSAGTALWLFSPEGPGHTDAGALAGLAVAVLGDGATPAVVTATCTPLSEDPPGGAGPRGGWMLPIPYEVPTDEVATLDRWYEEEHTELLLRCPAWLRVRRFAVDTVAGAAWNRLLVHDLATGGVLEAPEVVASMRTPRRLALAARPWFLAGGRRPLRRY